MPPSTWHPIYELLTRHGIDHEVAKAAANNDLRNWELHEIATIMKKVQRPSRDYCYFRHLSMNLCQADNDTGKWWSKPHQDAQLKWISPPRTLMKQAAQNEMALCINEQGKWSLRTSDYVALSHVWIEGLQRDKTHDGLSSQKINGIFTLLRSRSVQTKWVWTDVLVIPAGGDASSSREDETIILDIINTLPQIYSRADAVIIVDALLLQLHSRIPADIAVSVACGQWATRIWTFQEIKLASRALILTATDSYDYKMIVSNLKTLEDQDYPRYHWLWLHMASMMKDDARGLSIPDIVMSCGTRRSGHHVDYARAFFPLLGLRWEYGMTREEGMQKIYTSFCHHSSRIACFYGAPRMSIMPAWAPSAFHDLEGYVTAPMHWEERGIRGEWFAVRIEKIRKTFINAGRSIYELALDCPGDKTMQCICAPNEEERAIQAFSTAVDRGSCYVLSAQPSSDTLTKEFARHGLLVEKAEVDENDSFEAAVYCATAIPSAGQHKESKKNILLRHWSPIIDGDFQNQVQYMCRSQKGSSQPLTLPQKEDESDLHVVVHDGNIDRVIELVEAGKSIDSFNASGWTPLHVAAADGKSDILRYLLCQCPDIEIRGKQMNEDTPLSFAAFNGQANTVEILLEFGAYIHTRNKCEHTPIMVAAHEHKVDVVKTLLEIGANPNDEASSSGSALLLACGAGKLRLPVLEALIQGGANVNPPHLKGVTPVHEIAKWGGADALAYLLEQGCEADRQQWNGVTPLFLALEGSNLKCVKLLLDAGAGRNTVIEGNYRPIHYAANCENGQVMQMLLEKNDVELDAQTEPQGQTALHLAYAAKNMAVVKTLLKAGANPDVKDAEGRVPMTLLTSHPRQSESPTASLPPLPPRPSMHTDVPPLPPRPRNPTEPRPFPVL